MAREQALPLAVSVSPLIASVARPGAVGQYGAFLDVGIDTHLIGRLATNGFGLAYVCGWLLVPGALLGAFLAISKPRSRMELSFAALSVGLTVGLLAEASVWGDVELIQERYFFYALPLVALLFALYATRGWPHRRSLALLAVGALVVIAMVPVTFATAATMKIQSPFLFAAFRLEQAIESPGYGALAVAATVSVLVGVMLACSLMPSSGATVTLALATMFCALASLGAAALDLEGTDQVRERFLPAERSWIDETGLDDVAFLRTFPVAGDTYQQLFWNRSVRSLLLAPGVASPDAYRVERVSIGTDGTLLSGVGRSCDRSSSTSTGDASSSAARNWSHRRRPIACGARPASRASPSWPRATTPTAGSHAPGRCACGRRPPAADWPDVSASWQLRGPG